MWQTEYLHYQLRKEQVLLIATVNRVRTTPRVKEKKTGPVPATRGAMRKRNTGEYSESSEEEMQSKAKAAVKRQ